MRSVYLLLEEKRLVGVAIGVKRNWLLCESGIGFREKVRAPRRKGWNCLSVESGDRQ